jgi:hypothetical protein
VPATSVLCDSFFARRGANTQAVLPGDLTPNAQRHVRHSPEGRAGCSTLPARIAITLKAPGSDWVYHFPELGLLELTPPDAEAGLQPTGYSVSEAAVTELKAQQRRAEVQQFRADLAEMNARAREEAMDHPPPATVDAYRQVYGRDPRGWPPA